MKKIAVIAVLGLSLTACGGVVAKGNSIQKKNVDGTECVVATSQNGSVSVDCDFPSDR